MPGMITFYIANTNNPPILGVQACQILDLICKIPRVYEVVVDNYNPGGLIKDKLRICHTVGKMHKKHWMTK